MKYLIRVAKYRELKVGDQVIMITIDDDDDFFEPKIVSRVKQVVVAEPDSEDGQMVIQYEGEEEFVAPDHYEVYLILETI